MKIKLLLIILSISLISCSNSDDSNNDEEFILPDRMDPNEQWNNTLIGSWESFQVCESDFGESSCHAPNRIQRISFQQNLNFSTDELGFNCSDGTYNLIDDELNLEFSCSESVSKPIIYFLTDEMLILKYYGEDTALYTVYRKI